MHFQPYYAYYKRQTFSYNNFKIHLVKNKSYKNLLMSTAAEHQLAGELSTGNTSIFEIAISIGFHLSLQPDS